MEQVQVEVQDIIDSLARKLAQSIKDNSVLEAQVEALYKLLEKNEQKEKD